MGKPFQSELDQIADTIQWVYSEALPKLKPVWLDRSVPAYCIGSGGSQSAADFLARLIRSGGGFAFATTPLEYSHLGTSLGRSNAFLVSASGRNKDIVSAARQAIESESPLVGAIVTRSESPLANEVSAFSGGALLELEIPSGKDGFLATNSLIAMMLTLMGVSTSDRQSFPIAELLLTASDVSRNVGNIEFKHPEPELIIIHAGWGGPAALDLESKLSEAALAPSMICDLRNFGHGRHHWLAKRAAKTIIVTVEDNQYGSLFTKTLNLLPSNIEVIRLQSRLMGPAAAIDLTIRVFGLVRDLGIMLGIDPGRPGVPEFGRKIYHLSAAPSKSKGSNGADRASSRRARQSPTRNTTLVESLRSSASKFSKRLAEVKIHAIVFDYDGTIVDTLRRFEPISSQVSGELVRLLKSGLYMGVATGRGKSVREPLRDAIPQEFWAQVLVGYYNGSQIIPLGDDQLPQNEPEKEGLLFDLSKILASDQWISSSGAKIDMRPNQISIVGAGCPVSELWMYVSRLIASQGELNVKCVASTHSVDILPEAVSKIEVVTQVAKAAGCETANVLCIGDSGLWPGNDSELLAHFPALSCGSSPVTSESGWNFAPVGMLESKATHYYLSQLQGERPVRLTLEK